MGSFRLPIAFLLLFLVQPGSAGYCEYYGDYWYCRHTTYYAGGGIAVFLCLLGIIACVYCCFCAHRAAVTADLDQPVYVVHRGAYPQMHDISAYPPYPGFCQHEPVVMSSSGGTWSNRSSYAERGNRHCGRQNSKGTDPRNSVRVLSLSIKTSEPEVWGMGNSEKPFNQLKVKLGGNFTLFVPGQQEIKQVYLSRDLNCARRTLEMTIVKEERPAVNVKLPDEASVGEEGTHVHICMVPEVDFSFERAVMLDSAADKWRTSLIMVYVSCVCLSCLFSGLNLALLSLDMIKMYDENPKMRRYAEDIIPIRQDSNLMICTIILGNTMVNVISTVVFVVLTGEIEMEKWLNFVVVTICPTVITLIFGEILPQIVCTKYALPIGSHLKMVMQFFTFLMYPFSKALCWMLDFFVGEEKQKSSTLREIVRYAGRKDNMAMIANNTMEMRKKLTRDLMTPLSQVKMVSDTNVIDGQLRQAIRKGHTRLPVYKGGYPHNIVGVLNVKDLLLLDESNYITVGTVLEFWPRESTCGFVPADMPVPQLMTALRNSATMMIVTEYVSQEMTNVPTGIVTLEDLLEEIVGEIYDEKDRQKMENKEVRTEENSKSKQWKKKEGKVKSNSLIHANRSISVDLKSPFGAGKKKRKRHS